MADDIVLSQVTGGYDMKSVLMKHDAYASLLLMIEEGKVSDAVINAELEKVRQMPLKKAKFLFLPAKGYSIPHTDKHFEALELEIQQKIRL